MEGKVMSRHEEVTLRLVRERSLKIFMAAFFGLVLHRSNSAEETLVRLRVVLLAGKISRPVQYCQRAGRTRHRRGRGLAVERFARATLGALKM